MQLAFGFGADGDLAWVRDALRAASSRPVEIHIRPPIGQLIKSAISSRTRDEVSLGAYDRLTAAYPEWTDLACAPVAKIEGIICDVMFPDIKAQHLHDALCIVASSHPDFNLAFLRQLTVPRALSWLERLPGVGRKVAASTLNFSTLRMAAFVIDTHILRILHRFGFVGRKAETPAAYDRVMEMADGWSAADLAELHILMKRLGQTLCGANHTACRECPLSRRCCQIL